MTISVGFGAKALELLLELLMTSDELSYKLLMTNY